ncbi:MAG: metal transporter [Acidobacteria bacterium]|nr:metal transporter [Acidobacteriota bacterium]
MGVQLRDLRFWLLALLPVCLLTCVLGLLFWAELGDAIRGEDYPPLEELIFQKVELSPEGFSATVFNDGPNPVTIAQLQIDDAYWSFAADPVGAVSHLGQATLTIPYPWVHGETHVLRLVTSTGATFDHEVAVAVSTPKADARFLGIFTLIGLYVGVIPVAIGLLWLPFVKQVGRKGLDFLLALTVGLLLFLLVDAVHDGFEAASRAPGSYQGIALFLFVALAAFVGLEVVGDRLRRSRLTAGMVEGSGWVLALLVATGIGLHNFGEGLAIGAAFALGEVSLGMVLIVGFALHNTTEGLAIVAPLANEKVRLGQLVQLGVLGGAPTIVGAWIGGLLYSPIWSVVCLAAGTGAIAQVVLQLGRQVVGGAPFARQMTSRPVAAGLLAGVVVMYVTGLVVG